MVTGGAGFIGGHVVDRLLAMGERVVVVDDLNDFYDPVIKRANIAPHRGKECFVFYEVDITDLDSLARVFKENKIDHVVHLAARAGVRPSIENPWLYEKVNIGGTLNLLELTRAHGIKNFIFASSSSVYGNQQKTPYSEDDLAIQPISPYGFTKRAAELLAYIYSHLYDLNCICLRFFNVYGERGRPEMAFSLFTDALFNGKPIKRFGDGTTKRDYTYVGDIVDGVVRALDHDAKYEIINLGNSNPVPLNELIQILEDITGKKANIQEFPEQPGDVKATYADLTKAKRLLGWEPKVKIREGAKRYVDWHQKTYLS